jgi:hypothetical protein
VNAAAVGAVARIPLASLGALLVLQELLKQDDCVVPAAAALAAIVTTPTGAVLEAAIGKAVVDSGCCRSLCDSCCIKMPKWLSTAHSSCEKSRQSVSFSCLCVLVTPLASLCLVLRDSGGRDALEEPLCALY